MLCSAAPYCVALPSLCKWCIMTRITITRITRLEGFFTNGMSVCVGDARNSRVGQCRSRVDRIAPKHGTRLYAIVHILWTLHAVIYWMWLFHRISHDWCVSVNDRHLWTVTPIQLLCLTDKATVPWVSVGFCALRRLRCHLTVIHPVWAPGL